MVLIPAHKGVFGDSILRKNTRIAKDAPPIGTSRMSVSVAGRRSFVKLTVEVKTPTPGDAGSKCATNKRAQSACDSPCGTKKSVVNRTFPADTVSHIQPMFGVLI